VAISIREARDDDAAGIASLGQENSAYYVQLAPEYFRLPDEEGLIAFIENDREWRERSDTMALVAEDDGAIAGYLEASLQFPEDSARWQAQRDVSEIRLLIDFVGTADAYKRQGVATKARASSGGLGSRVLRGRRGLRHVHREPAFGSVLGAADGLQATGNHLSQTTRLSLHRQVSERFTAFCPISPTS